MASKQSTCWVIEHPEIGTAFVVADNWEQATVRAAEFWGVSWARTVSGMELVRRKDLRSGRTHQVQVVTAAVIHGVTVLRYWMVRRDFDEYGGSGAAVLGGGGRA